MTDVAAAFSGAECNGDTPPENGQEPIPQITEEAMNADDSPPYHRADPSLEEVFIEEKEEENEKSQGNNLHNWPMEEELQKEKPEENLFIVHKAITDLSLQETIADEMAFREGYQLQKSPLNNNNQEVIGQKERICENPLEEGEEGARESQAHQATEIEWLGFQKSSPVDVSHPTHNEEQEGWDEEINNDGNDDCHDDEDEVRVIEFKKKSQEVLELKDEGEASEDSPLSSPSSQPVTPDEHPALGKKNDISRNAYSRYNTISYRKIRKGNTKQRIDEFESMMHL
ncbi:PREDICTED: ermin [Elephantulus edwardii]|uniref:ermin n=1 Tax=Elephantulus edwardii TaxID=28737 RepID=UPI0003F06430|nr:PREDICTED: ermin [Elephantulus edwardii]